MNNIAPKAPLARQANQMAGHGRYGDSQLVHMNPYEVQGLASMSPTGQLTTNPVTGQPEAFLPFLAPIIGSMLGTTALGGTALGMAGAGALGSGLATWAATGDFEKGLISGVTGFGLGQVLGAGADAANQGVSTALQGAEAAQTGLAASNTGLMAAGVDAPTLLAGPPSPAYIPNVSGPGLNQGINTFQGPLTDMGSGITPAQLQNANLQAAVPNAMRDVNTARAALNPAQRMGGFTNGMDGLKAMGKQAMSPSSMLPMAVGVGTMAQVEQQETMENLRKEQLGEDDAYAQEWQDVLNESVGVANRSNQRQGRRPTAGTMNPYGGRYASGGVVGFNGGGETTDESFLPGETAEEAYARLGYIPYNSTTVTSQDNALSSNVNTGSAGDVSYGVGSNSLGTAEGDATTLTDSDVGQVVTNTAAGVDSLLNQGALLENITTNSGDAAAALNKGWQDEMKGQINAATSGVRDGRYFLDAKAGTGAERQSFLKGDFKQKPPSDYRHGFEKEFQFFDYVKDRPVGREADLFGAGASDYMAGLLAGNTGDAPITDTKTVAESAADVKSTDFSGVTGGITNADSGVPDLVAADSLKSTCYKANGDGTYTEIASDITGVCPTGSFSTKILADSSLVDGGTKTVVVDGGTGTVDDGSGTDIIDLLDATERSLISGSGGYIDNGDGTITNPEGTHILNMGDDGLWTATAIVVGGGTDTVGGDGTDPLAAFGTDIGSATDAEVASLVNMINSGATTIDAVAARYGTTAAAVQDYLDSLTAGTDPLAAFGTDIGSATDAEVASLVSMINSGATTIEAVASRYGTTAAAVQTYLDSLTAGTDPLAAFGTDIASATDAQVASLVSMISSGATTIEAVAARYGTTAAAVQTYLDSLSDAATIDLLDATERSLIGGQGYTDNGDGTITNPEGTHTLNMGDDGLWTTAVIGDTTVTDPLAAFGTDIDSATEAEVTSLVSMINSGATTIDAVAARYGTTAAAVQDYLDSLDTTGTGATVTDPLAAFGTDIASATDAEVTSLVSMISSGATTIDAVAARYGTTATAVQTYLDSLNDTGTGATGTDPLAAFGTDIGSATDAQVTSLVNMISSGATTIDAVAARYGTTAAAVQTYLDSLNDAATVDLLDATERSLIGGQGYIDNGDGTITNPEGTHTLNMGDDGLWTTAPVVDTTVTDPLAAFGTDIGSATDAQVTSLVNMINSGATTIDAVASRYGTTPAAVQTYLDSLDTTVDDTSTVTGTDTTGTVPNTSLDELKASGTIAGIRSTEEIAALAQGITEGKWTVDDVAAQFNVPAADVQAAYDSLNGSSEGEDKLSLPDDVAIEGVAIEEDGDPSNWSSARLRQAVLDGSMDYTAAYSALGVQDAVNPFGFTEDEQKTLGIHESQRTGEGYKWKSDEEGMALYNYDTDAWVADSVEPKGSPPNLSGLGSVAGIRSTEEIAEIAKGIANGDWTVDQVAAQFNVPAADVQAAYESISPDTYPAATGGRMASGGQARTKRFMTAMGPIELAAGGIAEIPADGAFMQEMPPEIPPEVAMVQEALMVEEPEVDYNELIAMTVEAIKGNLEDSDSVINMFIEEYGVERFRELRNAVLQGIVPNAQTEGMIAGSGNGMDDEVMGMIGENQPVAVSPGEYIVAADVLSGLGDGDTNAGADVMDEIQANVRMARSGGRQPAPIDLSKVMPA